jgi:hypothetical protein
MTGAGAGHEVTGAGAGHEITGAGAGQATGAGAGQATGAGAGQATGAGAGHGTAQHGPNLLSTPRLCRSFADALESNPASVTMSCANAIKMKYLALFLIVFLHRYSGLTVCRAVMKWITVIETMTASGYCGWPCVATLREFVVSRRFNAGVSYFTALRQDYSASPFHHRRLHFLRRVTPPPSPPLGGRR